MEYNEFKSIFENKEKEIEIVVSDENIKKLYEYTRILLEWNQNINLTAITDEHEIIEQHFVDSLTVLRYIKDGDKVIDVGTGAGYPGIPLAINSKAQITLLDSLNKRINFLNEVKNKLNLTNVHNIHGRAEEIARRISCVGPHRDDIEFKINGLDAVKFASQGQQRTLVLSLKLSELEIIKNKTGYSPILLLDDVLAELDETRQNYLLKSIEKDTQTIITSVDTILFEEEFLKDVIIYNVEAGRIVQ